jgi:capsular polysaccharide biosynthesis protein
MPIARQVQLFRQAEAIAAPHGAGLAHTAWCVAGTKIIEFFPSPGGPRGRVKNASADMWLIAAQRALHHRCYLAGPPETRADAFAIPEDLLCRALDEAGLVSN